MARNVVDNESYSFDKSNDPFIVTADFDFATMTYSNPSATVSEIKTVMDTGRPCILRGKTSGNVRYYDAVCTNCASSTANFVLFYASVVYTYRMSGSNVVLSYNSFDYLPFIVRGDYNTSTREITNLDKTAHEIYTAVNANNRPCVLLFESDGYTSFAAYCVYVNLDSNTDKYTAVFCKSSDGNDDTWVVQQTGSGTTTATHRSDFSQGIFAAASGVTATEFFYRKGMIFALNFSAAGTFSSGITTLGTYSGIEINSNGLGGVCLLLTGLVDNVPTYTTGYFTLAANGDLSVVSSVAYYGVKINLSYIWPL